MRPAVALEGVSAPAVDDIDWYSVLKAPGGPLDVALGISPHQNSSDELVRLGTLLSLFVPYELAAWLLGQFSGLRVSASSLWN